METCQYMVLINHELVRCNIKTDEKIYDSHLYCCQEHEEKDQINQCKDNETNE